MVPAWLRSVMTVARKIAYGIDAGYAVRLGLVTPATPSTPAFIISTAGHRSAGGGFHRGDHRGDHQGHDGHSGSRRRGRPRRRTAPYVVERLPDYSWN